MATTLRLSALKSCRKISTILPGKPIFSGFSTSATRISGNMEDHKYNVSPVVSAKWLATEIKKDNIPLKILDCSWHKPADKRDPRKEFLESHIPGASFFDIEECRDKDSEYPRMIPSAPLFEEYVSSLEVSNDSHVIVYENSAWDGLLASPRAWWMFRLFGHRLVSVLDGGFARWNQLSYPTASGPGQVIKTEFEATFNRSLVMSFEDMVLNIEEEHSIPVLDTRSATSFNRHKFTKSDYSASQPGHISGAVNVPYKEFVDPDTKTLKNAQELFGVFRKHKIDLCVPFISSCGTGVSACTAALCAHVCGAPDIPVYDGSFYEWSLRAQSKHIVIESTEKSE